MTYFEFDEGHPVDNGHITRTLLMAGALALATWDVWARHLAPFFFGTDLSVAVLYQGLLGIESRLMAEMLYFGISLGVLAPLYFFVWRPLMTFIMPNRHWSVDGLSFGIVLFTSVLVLHSLVGIAIPSEQLLFGWLPGVLTSWFMASLFIRLRELGCQIV